MAVLTNLGCRLEAFHSQHVPRETGVGSPKSMRSQRSVFLDAQLVCELTNPCKLYRCHTEPVLVIGCGLLVSVTCIEPAKGTLNWTVFGAAAVKNVMIIGGGNPTCNGMFLETQMIAVLLHIQESAIDIKWIILLFFLAFILPNLING